MGEVSPESAVEVGLLVGCGLNQPLLKGAGCEVMSSRGVMCMCLNSGVYPSPMCGKDPLRGPPPFPLAKPSITRFKAKHCRNKD